MYDLLKEFIRPELLVLVPVLYLIGMGLKKSTYIADKHIPLTLGAVSVILALLYLAATSDISGWQAAFLLIFTGITQGILLAGLSVYTNQLIKQAKE